MQANDCRAMEGAYDGQPTYTAIADACPPKSKPKIIIIPRKLSIPDKDEANGGAQLELPAARIAEIEQISWQKEIEYGLRSLGETAIFRIKSLTDRKLMARIFGAQKSEVSIKIAIANKAIRAAKPVSVRIQ